MKLSFFKKIQAFFLIIDVLIINTVIFIVFEKQHQNLFFYSYISLFWVISAIISTYYKVYRFTNFFKVFKLILIQFLFFTLGFFAFFGIFKEGEVVNTQFWTLFIISITLSINKTAFFFLLKKYRQLGKNYKKVVFFERDSTSKKMMHLFKKKQNLGYFLVGFFSNKTSNQTNYLGNEEDLYLFLKKQQIDEVYATLSILKKEQIKKLNKFTSINNITLKLIPSAQEFYSKASKTEFYNDTLKVLSVKKLPFDHLESRFLKRLFDIVFSLFIIIFLLSWLLPILWVLIKIESKGPAIFKQEREGLRGAKFVCYKFRSMEISKKANENHTIKNDARITRMGKFIRRTSIDELPQFFNVLLGNMSVVGPRPHIENLAVSYQKDVDNYIERHLVKPGITGLAQVSGYRGEIRKKADIKNRIRLDIFYIENWSFFLDLKIVIKTVLNLFKGDENAY